MTGRRTPNLKHRLGDPVKINPKNQAMGEVFPALQEQSGESSTPKGDVSCKHE
ncbi:MAG: hypothetical protein ACRDHW_08350 [Ktedonobacteraceae bacterium]